MRGLLLVAHGSRLEAANDEVRRITGKLRARAGANYGFVDCAFLELASPNVPEGMDACVAAGAKEVVVVPYFLAAGRHIREDIPAEIARSGCSGVRVRVCEHVGMAEGMPDLLMSMAARAGNR